MAEFDLKTGDGGVRVHEGLLTTRRLRAGGAIIRRASAAMSCT